MAVHRLVTFSVLLVTAAAGADLEYVYEDIFNDPQRDALLYDTFPDDFAFSVATSSHQIEGAWNEDGKGPNIWDTFTHQGGKVIDNATADIACDSYHKYREDVALIASLGLKYYRFSISWARVLPDGTIDNINEAGIQYYSDLIDELLANDIQPMVTLYHWDLPQALHDSYGGWQDEAIVDDFANYADFCFTRLGDRVKFWITINEPWIVALHGYESGIFAPGINEPGTTPYVVGHNLIKAHAKAWHSYDDNYRSTQNGRIGIALNSDWAEPYDRSDDRHVAASEQFMQFTLGWFGHAIYKNGDYPEIMKTRIADISAEQGFNESRLPEFTDAEKVYNAKTADFFGLNHYTTNYVTNATSEDYSLPPYWGKDLNIPSWKEAEWPTSGSNWLQSVPWGIRQILVWIDREYDGIDSYVTENGISTADVYDLSDESRMKYYKSYINEVLKAVKIDGASCKGYTAWTLMDNFEWGAGYTERFGMHYVDFDDEELTRVQKDSATLYASIISDNGFIISGSDSNTLSIFIVILVLLQSLTIFFS